MSGLPVRDALRGKVPYGAPQIDVAVRLNTNENLHPPSAALVDDLSAAVRSASTSLNRYPDREATALRRDLACYLSDNSGHRIAPEQEWAANGSNEVIQQILLPSYERLVVTRTMSKAFAMAGTRVGYLAAAPSVVDVLRLVRLPYHLSTLTQVVASVALAHSGELLSTVDLIRGERDRLVDELTQLGLPGWLRVTAGQPSEVSAFLSAFEKVLA